MIELKNYMQDGASAQTKAVLAMLQDLSLSEENDVYVNRWTNGRERGYNISMRMMSNGEMKQLNIAFFEHRNSDEIHALKWNQFSLNPISTYEDAKFPEGFYEKKRDTSFHVSYGEITKMAEWIESQFNEFRMIES